METFLLYITPINLLVLVFSYILAQKMLPLLIEMLKSGGLVKKNWQEKYIPTAVGIVFPFVLLISLIPYIWCERSGFIFVYVLGVLGAALVGLVDDVLGNSEEKGIYRHLRCLLRKKKLSTGTVKAIGIGFLAVWIITLTGTRSILETFVDWFLLVLSVNLINLLDLRPGRAIKGVVFLYLFPAFLPVPGIGLLFSCVGTLLAYAPYDLNRQVMLGDTGANALGLTAGVLLLETPLFIRFIFLTIFVLLHLVAEKYSFTTIIEKSVLLRKLDRWGQKISPEQV